MLCQLSRDILIRRLALHLTHLVECIFSPSIVHAIIHRHSWHVSLSFTSARDEALRLKGEADARAALEVIAREFATKERERVEAAMDRVRYGISARGEFEWSSEVLQWVQ